MSTVEAVARRIDRLVWAVSDTVREQHGALPASSRLEASTFGPLLNLMPFRHHLTAAFIRRRYIYRPKHVMTTFLADLEATGLFTRDDDHFVPTDLLIPIVDEIGTAIDEVSRGFWLPHEETVLTATLLSRKVLEAADSSDSLVAVAQTVDEPTDPFHCFWQRLAGLRLIRNEAHVDAWRTFDLSPGDVEVLTGAWAGTALQAPVMVSESLIARGYAADGAVTASGLDARQQIEDATDDGVSAAFAVIDTPAFLELLNTLPPEG